jgi:Potential Queuosine, Q, salvage protein family
MTLLTEVRSSAAEIAAGARWVSIDLDAVGSVMPGSAPALDPECHYLEGTPAEVTDYLLALNAINFGSGWFPTLRKRPGMSGFRTMEAGLTAHGPWTAQQLRALTREEIAHTMGQDPGHELMGLFETALNELGQQVGGSFLTFARAGNGSAEALATQLAALPTWADTSRYGNEDVPLYKRAQIAAADLALQGLAPANDLHRLTLFADNLVPHVLKLDGVLHFDPALDARIEAEQLLEHGSAEEVEIRAVALHAVELLVQAHGSTTATAVDNLLWNRGAGPRYKARPRHRARTTAYST